jgi:hypothetical protein
MVKPAAKHHFAWTPQRHHLSTMKKLLSQKALFADLLAITGLLNCGSSFAQICTREYAPVCGQVAGVAEPRTFANRCLLDAAQATVVSQGECTAQPTPLAGSDLDTHSCKGSAGFQWNEELNQCVRPWMSSAITLEVAPHRRACTGLIKMQCLMVREDIPGQPPQQWEPLFSNISGFTHTPGKRYKLRVRKDLIENPPADAANTTYTLLRVMP